jgi:hypothetical protein
MIDDQEHVRTLMQYRQELTELSGLVEGVCAEIGDNRWCPGARKVVDSEMKYGSFERDAPLQ